MTHTIRQATVDDVEELVPLFDAYRQFYGRTSDVAAARRFLFARFANRESTLFIAHQGNAAIGFAQLYPSFSPVSLARIFILNDLFVQEQARRTGVASSLLSAAASVAVSLDAVRLSLSTALTNDAAQVLYRSAGWTRDEQFSIYHQALPAN
ncbi:MAG: GNAT family N-acetyltransferase [Nitrospira sp.]|nr:GNAT family N-acetyltransferase [Nitrospira sp.]